MADCNENEQFEDNVMSVTYVPIKRSETYSEDFPADNEKSVQVGTNTSDASTSTRSTKKKRRSRSMSASSSIVEDDTDYYAHESKNKRRRKYRSGAPILFLSIPSLLILTYKKVQANEIVIIFSEWKTPRPRITIVRTK